MDTVIQTITGPVKASSFGLILPHEHLFTDLRGPLVPDYARANPADVEKVVQPYLSEAHAAGVTAIVECSTVGVGRNIEILLRLAEASRIRIVAPTGVYREAFTPPSMLETDEEDLAELWTRELTQGIGDSAVRAGFIKLAMSDDGPTALEKRNLRAAARASQETGAVIASHTIGGIVARKEMDILEAAGLDLGRFIWVHAQTAGEPAALIEAVRQGAYVELDSVGAPHQSEPELLRLALAIIEAGRIDRLLLSHDAGWYNPARPDGLPDEGYRGYTALTQNFVPELRRRGISEAEIFQITATNPARALAFQV